MNYSLGIYFSQGGVFHQGVLYCNLSQSTMYMQWEKKVSPGSGSGIVRPITVNYHITWGNKYDHSLLWTIQLPGLNLLFFIIAILAKLGAVPKTVGRMYVWLLWISSVYPGLMRMNVGLSLLSTLSTVRSRPNRTCRSWVRSSVRADRTYISRSAVQG